LPLESNVALGSLQASAVWPSSSVNCQNGGVWSPQVFPPSKDQSYPQWLNPRRESFCPAMRLSTSSGLTTMTSSAWRRSEQSWLTRTFAPPCPPPSKRFEQPCVPCREKAFDGSLPAAARRSSSPVASS